MTYKTWLLFLVMETALCLTPGPAVFYVVSHGVRGVPRRVLPQFIDTRGSVVAQMMILAVTSMLPEFCILSAYGWLAHRAAHATAKLGVTSGMNRWLARIEGAGMIGCATLVLKFNRAG